MPSSVLRECRNWPRRRAASSRTRGPAVRPEAGDPRRDEWVELERIEHQLTLHDTEFGRAFRRWRAARQEPRVPAGYTTVAPWAMAVFAVALTAWTAGPGPGAPVAVAWLALLFLAAGGQENAGSRR